MKPKNIIGLIILIIIVFVLIKSSNIYSSLDIPITEGQLKKQYSTYWDDTSDGIVTQSTCSNIVYDAASYNAEVKKIQAQGYGCVIHAGSGSLKYDGYYEDSKFIITGRGHAASEGGAIKLTAGQYENEVEVKTKQQFEGESIILVSEGDGCHIIPYGEFDCYSGNEAGTSYTYCEPSTIIFKPYTFENAFDVYQNGAIISKYASQSISLGARCNWAGGRTGKIGFINFIGYKAAYSCELSAQEVWIEERFDSQFNKNDLSFTPTKFCDDEHPATLRTLDEGEKKIYPNPYYALNDGETIPGRTLEDGEQITVRYATYYIDGVIEPLQPNQQWKCTEKVNGVCQNWAIDNYVKPQEIVQCIIDDDCLSPCNGITVSCQNNICEYSGECNIRHEIVQCTVDDDCLSPCNGIISSCQNNTCEYSGQCINSTCITDSDCNSINMPCVGVFSQCSSGMCTIGGKCLPTPEPTPEPTFFDYIIKIFNSIWNFILSLFS